MARRFALALVLATSAVAVAAPPAQALLSLSLPGPLGSGPTSPQPQPTPTTTTGLLTQTLGTAGSLLTGQIGLGTTAETLACPVAKTLTQLAPPGSPGVSQATFVACVLHFLDFEWRTTHPGRPPLLTDDRIVTTLGVPTPLNLDTDLLPEALGTVLVLAPNVFQLSFRRIDLGLKGDLPSTAELIITDPSGGSLPTSKIGLGLAANKPGDRFPNELAITFTLESFKPPLDYSGTPRFRIDVDSAAQAKRAAITADLFDESAARVRDSDVRAEVGMKPVPARLSTRVTLRDDLPARDTGTDVDITHAATRPIGVLGLLNATIALGPPVGPPTVDAAVTLRGEPDAQGTRRIRRLNARLADLPSYSGLRYRTIGKTDAPSSATREAKDQARGGQTVDYASASRLTRLEVGYDDVMQPAGAAAEVPSLRARLRAGRVPTGMSVSQLGSFTTFLANDAGIERTEAEFAMDGEIVTRRTDRPGLRFVREDPDADGRQPLAIAARIDGVHLTKLDNLGGRAVLDVGMARQPFDIDARDVPSGLTATATIEDLPANAHVEYLPAQPAEGESAEGEEQPLRVKYDAGDHAIGRIAYKAAFDETQGGLLDQIEGHITDLPPVIDVTADLEDKVYEFNASKPFGVIEGLARNRKAVDAATVPPLSAGATGASAILRDDGTFAALARVHGLKNVKADLENNAYHVEAGAVPFEARALVDEVRGSGAAREVLPRQMLATIDRLPGRIDLKFDEEGDDEKLVTYDASAGIGKIALQLDGEKLYAPEPKVNRVRAGLFDVPSSFVVRLGNAGKLDLDAGPGIGKIESLITSGPDPELPADQHAAYVEKGRDIVVKAQLLGFTRFTLDPDPLDVRFDTRAAKRLDVDVKADLDGDDAQEPETTAHIDISQVPAKLHASYDGEARLHYDADGGADTGTIGAIHANAHFLEQRGGRSLPRDLSATVEGVPSEIDVALTDEGREKKLAYDANRRTDRVALELRGDALYAGEERVDRLRAAVVGIPRHLAATLGTGGAFAFDGATGIDRIEALVTSGPDPDLRAHRHQAYAQRDSEAVVGKVQLLGFKAFELDPEPLTTTFETAAALPLEVDAHVDEQRGDRALGREATLDIDKVPAKIEAALTQPAPGTQAITYEGSSRIEALDATLKGDELLPPDPSVPGTEKIDRVEAHVAGIPKELSARLGSDGAIDLGTGGAGIDEITALATSGPDPGFTDGSHGAYAETGDDLVVKARLLGFKEFKLAPDPLDVTFETTAARPLEVDAKLDLDEDGRPEVTAGLDLKNVPATMRLALQKDGTYGYDASGRIDELALTAAGLPDLPDAPAKIDLITATLRGVPAHLDAGYGDDGQVSLKGTKDDGSLDAVTSAELTAQSRRPPALPTTLAASHAAFRLVGNEAAARVRIAGLREIDITPTPLDAVVDTDVLGALDLDAKVDADGSGTFEKQINAELRTGIHRVTVKDELARSSSRFLVDTGDPFDTLHLRAVADDLPLGIETVDLDVFDIPEITRLRFPRAGGQDDLIAIDLLERVNGVEQKADGIDRIDLDVNDGGLPRSTVTTADGVTHTATDGFEAKLTGSLANPEIETAALRLRGLRGFSYQTRPHTAIGVDVAPGQARPLALDATLEQTGTDLFATGHIDRLPDDLLLELAKRDDTPIAYSAGRRIDEIHLETNFLEDKGLPRVEATISDPPSQFEVCFRTDGQRATCIPSNRFDDRTDKLISAAYESDVTATGTRPDVFVRACFASQTCASGPIATLDVKVPRKIELEAGAGATAPTIPAFDCFDEYNQNGGLVELGRAIGCTALYPGRVVAAAAGSASARAFVWVDTGATALDGTATYTMPSPTSVLDPIVLALNVPSITADQAFLEANASLSDLANGTGIVRGGALTCTGGDLGISTRFKLRFPGIDLPAGALSTINDAIDASNTTLGTSFAHLTNPIIAPFDVIDRPLAFSLIDDIC